MRIVSPLLKHVLYPSLAMSGLLRHAAAQGFAVVTYHGVLPRGYETVDAELDGSLVRADVLRRQVRLLKARYNVIAPEDLRLWCRSGRELPASSVLITCDDGLLNNLSEVLPVLQQEGVRCLFFVTGASAGDDPATLWYEELFLMLHAARAGRFEISSAETEIRGELRTRDQRRAVWWDAVKRLSQVDAEGRRAFLRAARAQLDGIDGANSGREDAPWRQRFHLLRRAELVQLDSAGMTIGAHTLSHPMLSQCSSDLARTEITQGRLRLEAVLGKPVWAFAYPFGTSESVTLQVLEMAKDAGYDAAFLNFGGGLRRDISQFAIPRVHVTAAMSPSEFEAHVAGIHGSLQRWVRGNSRSDVFAQAETRHL